MNASRIPVRQVMLAYLLLFSLLISLWLTVLQPLWEAYQDRQYEIDTTRHRVEQLERTISTDPALDKDTTKLLIDRLKGYLDSVTMSEPTVDIAGSLLQKRLVSIVQNHDGIAGNTTISSDLDARTVTVSMHFTANLAGLKGVLYELEVLRPHIFVDLLAIQIAQTYGAEAVARQAPQRLEIQLDASALWLMSPSDEVGS